MTKDLTAAQAAQMAKTAEAQTQAEHAATIQPAVAHALSEIAGAAGNHSLYGMEVSLRPFHLTPPQLLSVSRELKRRGFAVTQQASALDVFQVGWSPTPTPRTVLLREGAAAP